MRTESAFTFFILIGLYSFKGFGIIPATFLEPFFILCVLKRTHFVLGQKGELNIKRLHRKIIIDTFLEIFLKKVKKCKLCNTIFKYIVMLEQ